MTVNITGYWLKGCIIKMVLTVWIRMITFTILKNSQILMTAFSLFLLQYAPLLVLLESSTRHFFALTHRRMARVFLGVFGVFFSLICETHFWTGNKSSNLANPRKSQSFLVTRTRCSTCFWGSMG